ncbi:zinc-responsiveness transcriptional activator [Colletotrichum incanum]|nr:zinc-responsiveness transcriptional activator [Colletotrichum incanum]
MDDHQDGFSTAFDPNQSLFNMPYSTMVPDHDHDHFLGGTLSISHDESCLDLKYDHVACRGPENNHQHHPVPNHNHPRINLNSIPMLQRRHHSISTMPGIPNFFESKDQSPVGFGANALMSPTAHVDFAAMIHTDSSTNVEDDSTSAACSSLDCNQCASDCGASEAGDICRDAECGPACDDDECERAASPCEDAECLARSLSEKDKAAAGVLASFGGENSLGQNGMATSSMPSLQTSQFFPNQSSFDNGVMTAASQSSFHNGGLPSTMVQSMNMDGFYQCDLDSLPTTYLDASMDGNFDWASWAAHIANEHSSGACSPGTIQVSTKVLRNRESSTNSSVSRPPTASSPVVSPETILSEASSITSEQFACKWHKEAGGQVCGLVFQDDEGLQNHCREQHLKNLNKTDNGFKCRWEGCSRDGHFTQKSKLERHLQTHTGYKPVKCTICGLALSAKQSLAQHMRIHTGEKPWACQHPGCGAAFKQQSALTMHMRTHTGEKPLSCDVCGKAFGESSNLSKHRKTHNVKGAFKCDFCDKDFHRLDQKRRHEKTHRTKENGGAAVDIETSHTIRKTQGGRVTKNTK